MGPATSQESAGASRSADPVDESLACGENGGAATSQNNPGAVAACSNVASGAMLTEILEAATERRKPGKLGHQSSSTLASVPLARWGATCASKAKPITSPVNAARRAMRGAFSNIAPVTAT